MRLAVTLCVRDEKDIIGDTLRFYVLQGVDQIIVTDNGSVDGTRDILSDFAKSDGIHIIDEPSLTFSQGDWVTRMARLAASDYHVDWVINADADEFYWPNNGLLKDALDAIPSTVGVVPVGVANFVYVPGPSSWLDRLIYREIEYVYYLDSRTGDSAGHVFHRADPRVVVFQGMHEVASTFAGMSIFDEILVLHFPTRSVDQLAKKISNAGSALKNNSELPYFACRHHRDAFASLEAGRFEDDVVGRLVYDRQRLENELQSGVITEDLRLKDFLSK